MRSPLQAGSRPVSKEPPLSWSRLIPSRRARLREVAPECAPPPPAVALRSSVILFDLFGAPSKTRTPDPLIRSKPESRTMGKTNLEKAQQRSGSTALRSSRRFMFVQPVTAPDRHLAIFVELAEDMWDES